jgi:uncharacterized protein YegL
MLRGMTINNALIVVVLDRSGSMENIREDTIGGFNAFLEEQKKVPGRCLFTLAQFDNVYEVVAHNILLTDAQPLTRDTFVPRGGTALLDAMGRTLNTLEQDLAELEKTGNKPEKIYFVLITDGDENQSTEFSRDQVFQMISDRRQNSAWEFIFLAANQDAIKSGGNYGFAAGSSMSYNDSGTRGCYGSVSSNIASSRFTGQSISFSAGDRNASMGH